MRMLKSPWTYSIGMGAAALISSHIHHARAQAHSDKKIRAIKKLTKVLKTGERPKVGVL